MYRMRALATLHESAVYSFVTADCSGSPIELDFAELMFLSIVLESRDLQTCCDLRLLDLLEYLCKSVFLIW